MKCLTIKEAAELARCSAVTIRRAIHAGKLPAYKPGKQILIEEKDFRAWFRSSQVMPAKDPRLIRFPHPKVARILN